jgi:S-adenosylmethionine decarboxylase
MSQNPFAPGKHLLLDFYDAQQLTNLSVIELALKNAAHACSAKILNIKLHSFGENAGVTGVALLAESHITIHTWPESSYAAIDIFMCGNCEPEHAIEPLSALLKPLKIDVSTHQRGLKIDRFQGAKNDE